MSEDTGSSHCKMVAELVLESTFPNSKFSVSLYFFRPLLTRLYFFNFLPHI